MLIDCLVLGDSIAVGVARIRTDCTLVARSGINSKDYLSYCSSKGRTKVVVISLGSNDYKGIDTRKNLIQLRSSIEADKVYWILPSRKLKPDQYLAVSNVAKDFNDLVISTEGVSLSLDQIHPTQTGYKSLASIIR